MAVLGVGEELVEGGAVEIFSAKPDGLNLGGVVDVGEGIGGEQDEVGALAGSDGAEFGCAAEKFRGAQSGGLQGGERSEAGFNQQSQLVMQAEAGHAVRIHGVRAGKQGHAGAEHQADHLLVRFEEAAVELEL